MSLKVVDQFAERSGSEHHVAIHREHERGGGFTENQIAGGGALHAVERDVAIVGNPVGRVQVSKLDRWDELSFSCSISAAISGW